MSNTERPRVWVVIANVTPTTLYTMVGLRGPTIKNAGCWNFFGGNVDDGENPKDAACRELFEETGMQVDPEALVMLFQEQVQTKKGKCKPCTWFVVPAAAVDHSCRRFTTETVEYDWIDHTWEAEDNLHYSVRYFIAWWRMKQEQYAPNTDLKDITHLKQLGILT